MGSAVPSVIFITAFSEHLLCAGAVHIATDLTLTTTQRDKLLTSFVHEKSEAPRSRYLEQGHVISGGQKQDLNPGLPDSRSPLPPFSASNSWFPSSKSEENRSSLHAKLSFHPVSSNSVPPETESLFSHSFIHSFAHSFINQGKMKPKSHFHM